MHRRNFLAAGSVGLLTAGTKHPSRLPLDACDCSFVPQAGPAGLQAFSEVSSGLKITGVKVFGVSAIRGGRLPARPVDEDQGKLYSVICLSMRRSGISHMMATIT